MASSILVVHDRPEARRALREGLAQAGHSVIEAAGLPLPAGLRPDLVLVDYAALDPAAERLRELKGRDGAPDTRVIVLAPPDRFATAVHSLELGADDCMLVPFDQAELAARVAACLRRPAAKADPERLSAGPVELDRATHRVLILDHSVELAPTEFRLMAFLLENQGRVFSRSELLRRAWGRNIKAGPRTVDVHVRRLRQQLEPFGCESIIQTVRGFGYRLSVEQAETRGSVRSLHLSASRT